MSNKAQAWAWQVEIGGVAKLVLVALADHADDKGICWPGARGLAAKCGVTERTIRANLKQLAEQGLIEAEERKRDDGSQASNRYYLNMEISSPWGVNASSWGETFTPQGEVDREGGVKQKGSLEPSLETKLETKDEPSLLFGVANANAEQPAQKTKRVKKTPEPWTAPEWTKPFEVLAGWGEGNHWAAQAKIEDACQKAGMLPLAVASEFAPYYEGNASQHRWKHPMTALANTVHIQIDKAKKARAAPPANGNGAHPGREETTHERWLRENT